MSAAIRNALANLGIDPALVRARKLKPQPEARLLAPAGLGTDGRDKLLAPAAARAWKAMQRSATRAGVELQLVSGFRSLEFQVALLRQKLAKGRTLEEILTVNAPPGFSEHHTGCAVDIGTPGCPPLEEAFESTAAYAWLAKNARRFGFTLSYPRNNPEGFLYEPWHWRFRPTRRA